jgi:hypothetical protein
MALRACARDAGMRASRNPTAAQHVVGARRGAYAHAHAHGTTNAARTSPLSARPRACRCLAALALLLLLRPADALVAGPRNGAPRALLRSRVHTLVVGAACPFPRVKFD